MDASARSPSSASARRLALLAGALAVSWTLALLDAGSLREAADLHALADGANPWWVPAHFFLLYVRAPLAILSASLLFLSPGLAATLALGGARSLGSWVVRGLAAAIVATSAVTAAASAIASEPLLGARFGLVPAALALAFLALAAARVRSGAQLSWPIERGSIAAALAPALALSWLTLAALAPKIHWETFTGDGAHAFEATRLLLRAQLPFWEGAGPEISGFPGTTTMLFCYPGSWFLRLFGEIEGAARAPVAMYLLAVAGGVAAFAGSDDALRGARGALLAGSLGAYVLTMAFSASYDAYSADLALPATQDTLLVALVLGVAASFARRELAWLALFALLAHLTLPSGLLLGLLWVAAALAFVRPRPVAASATLIATIAAAKLVEASLPRLLAALDLPAPGGEYESVASRFLFLQVSDLRRVLYAAIPCGIFPLLAFVRWRALDPWARALGAATLGYFALFYVQAYVSLHHFVPCMLLPIAVHAHLGVRTNAGARALFARAAMLAAAIALAWPATGFVATHARAIGRKLVIHAGDYARSEGRAFHAAAPLHELFARSGDPCVPERCYGGSPLVWNHYARHGGDVAGASYAVLDAAEPAPPGMAKLAERDGFAVYVRDLEELRRDRERVMPSPPGAPLLSVDRGILCRDRGGPRERWMPILKVRSVLRRLGLAS
jgi:hypothetical protein